MLGRKDGDMELEFKKDGEFDGGRGWLLPFQLFGIKRKLGRIDRKFNIKFTKLIIIKYTCLNYLEGFHVILFIYFCLILQFSDFGGFERRALPFIFSLPPSFPFSKQWICDLVPLLSLLSFPPLQKSLLSLTTHIACKASFFPSL